MKYLFIMTTSANVINFRKSLIRFLQEQGHTITIIAHDNIRERDIRDLGVEFFCVKQDNRGLNPFAILKYKRNLQKIISSEKPDVVFAFQLKPNVFGVKASKKAGVKNIFSMVEGLGDVYLKTGLKWKTIRFIVNNLYKSAFKISKVVFFLNNDDKAEFINRKLVSEDKCKVINGIGVDLNRFEQKPLNNYNTFLMVARMLKTKGVLEYLECARRVKKQIPSAVFNYLGGEGDVNLTDIKEYLDDGSINYLGVVNDVRQYLEDCSVFVLPTYREGLPVSIIEAESVGRAIITTNAVGAKETVKNGYNGFLVETKNLDELTEKAIYLLENKEQIELMGKNSRIFAEQNFDAEKINEKIYEIISK